VCVCVGVRIICRPISVTFSIYVILTSLNVSNGPTLQLHNAPHNQLQNRTLPAVCLLDFGTTVNFYAFKENAFVAVCTDKSDTPVSWDTRVKDFRGYASETHFTTILCFLRRNMCSLSLIQ